MSISVGHRAIASAVGWGHGTARRTAGPLPVPESSAPELPATILPAPTTAAQPAVEPGDLVCSPWEGLYLAQSHPATVRGNEAMTRQQLDSFLNSLMYGE
jgi:DMSO/TMAO reductase YedYZ molybdopterin-dependent catalytic subunit